jgi:hypothetical protein
MPKYDGVYQDGKGRWYFKVWLDRDPLTGALCGRAAQGA